VQTARLLILLLTLVLPGIVLAPAWREAGVVADEDSLRHLYPARVFLYESVQAGQLSWLNPQDGLGRPLVADPQSAVFYPATWLFAALGPAQAYPVSLWLHYSLALWGMYRLLRAQHLARQAALFGGIAFAFAGFLLAHRAELAVQQAAAWTPWTFWRLQRYAQVGGNRRLASAALAAALQCFAGHPQIAAITALGSLVFLLVENRSRSRVARRWLLGCSCAAGLFTIQWLPTLAYLSACPGPLQGYGSFAENSWNPISGIGLVLPMFFGQRIPGFFGPDYWGPSHPVEQFAYAGILPLLLAAIAIRAGWRTGAHTRGWAALLFFGLLLALGRYSPICPIIHWISGATLLRQPAHAMLLFNLAIAALAASALHDLGSKLSPDRARLRAIVQAWTRNPLVKAVGLLVVPLTPVAVALPLLNAEVRQSALSALYPGNPGLWVPALTVAASVALLWFASRRWRQPRWLSLLVVMTTLDLGVIGWTLDVPAGEPLPSQRLATPGGEAWLARQAGSAGRFGGSDRGQAFFEDATQPGAVRYIEKTPHSFVTRIDTWPLDAKSGGALEKAARVRVVVSRPALPGWKARSNDHPLEVSANEDGLLVASVPAGTPLEIEWSYSPPGLYVGAGITVLTGVLLACAALYDRFARRTPRLSRDSAER
jgi:hypothetical protein